MMRSGQVPNLSEIQSMSTLSANFRKILFVCFVVYGPVNPMGSCRSRSVDLTTLLLGRLSPLSSLPGLCTFFCQKLATVPLNQRKGENGRRKYFMIKSPRKIVADLAGVDPATSWSPPDAHPTTRPSFRKNWLNLNELYWWQSNKDFSTGCN